MPVVTLQLGQCGNQLGCSFFQALSTELGSCDYGKQAIEEYFRPLQGAATRAQDRYIARAVLIDMEPKVVNAARSTAEAAGGWWRYSPTGFLCMQSGSGNNWAHGFHGYGPSVREEALDLVRREVEACDLLGGFSLLQSMAGGTGAGLGTYISEALRDEYQSSHIINSCVWPYESGEVIVQSYNTLLTLSHLADVSDGIVLMNNEALHKLCMKLFNIKRPSFNDINMIAARAMANLLLPSSHRSIGGTDKTIAGAGAGAARRPSPQGRLRPSSLQSPGTQPSPSPDASPLRLLPELVSHLCCHPHFRLLSLRSIPQVPAASADFTTLTWQAMLKRLRQMLLTGSVMEEGMDWGITMESSPDSRRAAGLSANKSLANWLVLRGQASGEVNVSDFADPTLYPAWSISPLLVSNNNNCFNKFTMSAAMLSNDQAGVGPIRRMQDRAYSMLASRAFVHQYETFGLGQKEFQSCFAHVEEMVERYTSL